MEASAAAARYLDDYGRGIQRLGSYGKKLPEPKVAAPNRFGRVYLLALAPLFLVPTWWLMPIRATSGYAAIGGRPLSNAKIVLFSESGENYEATTDKEGGFSLRLPAGIYKAMANGSNQSVSTEVVPGKTFRIPFLPRAKKPIKARRSAS
jgi:hypothetical protein